MRKFPIGMPVPGLLLLFCIAMSCTKEIQGEQEQKEELVPCTIRASLDQTKAVISGLQILWQDGDRIAVFDGTAKREFTLSSGAGTKSACFVGEISQSASTLSAISPYSAAGDNAGEFTIPQTQTFESGLTVDPSAVVMSAPAVAKGTSLHFTNPCGVARMKVPAGTMAGGFSASGYNCELVFPEALAAEKTIDLLLPAGDYTNLLVCLQTSEGSFVKYTTNVFSLGAGSVVNLGNVKGESATVISTGQELKSYLQNQQRSNAYVIRDLDLTDIELPTDVTLSTAFECRGCKIMNWTSSSPMFETNSKTGSIRGVVLDESCNLTINASGNSSFVCGTNSGKIMSCVNNADIHLSATSSGTSYVGAIAARQTSSSSAKITDCANNGNFVTPDGGVAITGELILGGVIGSHERGSVENCSNTGNVVLNATTFGANVFFGGVVGCFCNSTITGCRNDGEVTLKGQQSKPMSVGGVVGGTPGHALADVANTGSVSGCINAGVVTLETTGTGYSNVGGIIGYLEGSIQDCSTTVSSEVYNIQNEASVRTGASVGGIAGRIIYDAEDCSNAGKVELRGYFAAGTDGKAYTVSSGAPVVGGVFGSVGISGQRMSGCSNTSSNIIADVKMGSTNSTSLIIGGVAGYIYSNTDGCTNSGNLYLDKCEHASARIGGIAGQLSAASIENSTNSGNVTVKALLSVASACSENSARQFYIGGIVGYSNVTGASVAYCSNRGKIYLQQMRDAGAFSYVGGIAGSLEKAQVKNCSNFGECASDAASKVRIAGIAANIAGSGAVYNVNSGAINVKNAVSSSVAGGAFGHVGCDISECRNGGDITLTSCSAATVAGLLLGTVGDTNYSWNGNVIDGTLTGSGVHCGYLLGGQTTGTKATKVGYNQTNKMKSSATVNGKKVESSYCSDKSKLIGDVLDASRMDLASGGVRLVDDILVEGYVKYSDSTPAVGVSVSDGFNVAVTDSRGYYALDKDSDSWYIYVSYPSDAVIAKNATTGCPDFFKRYDSGIDTYNFTFERQAVETRFNMIVLADPQAHYAKRGSQTKADTDRFRDETVPAVNSLVSGISYPCYGLTLGDIVYSEGNRNSNPGLTTMRTHFKSMNIPVFQTIGNHDYTYFNASSPLKADANSSTYNLKAQRAFEEVFGPINYSFNRGDVHFICMRNIIYESTTSWSEYRNGFTDAQVRWLEADLANVPTSKMIVFCAHAPMVASTTDVNLPKVVEMLSKYPKCTIFTGHAHYKRGAANVRGSGIYEHVHAAVCGQWWCSKIEGDGCPNGYTVYDFNGNAIVDEYFLGTNSGMDSREYQMRLYRGNVKTGGSHAYFQWPHSNKTLLINVFNGDSRWGKPKIYENGVYVGQATLMPQKKYTFDSVTSGSTYNIESDSSQDWWAIGYHVGKMGQGTSSTSYYTANFHMYKFELSSSTSSVRVEATDPYGRVYTCSDVITNGTSYPSYIAR